MKNSLLALSLMLLVACSPSKKSSQTSAATPLVNKNAPLNEDGSFYLTEISTDKTYGLTPQNAVQVGGADKQQGPTNEKRYLYALAGPQGEKVSFYRAGSCCPVKSKNGFNGYAMLDNYRVTWEGSTDTVSIYINMYDYGEMKVPVGFTIKP